MRSIYWSALLSIVFVVSLSAAAAGQSLKPEEIVQRHLNAIGTAEKRAAMKSVMAIGASEFESNVPVVKGGGRAVIVSDPTNLFFIISLNSKDYPFEKIGYFDGKPSLPFSTAGSRSLLGAFLAEHSEILGEGLYTGVTSMRWPLFDVAKRKPRLSGGGTKKVDDKKYYVIDYVPSSGGSSEFTMKLFFDPETFHHVRTEYRYEVQPKDAVFGQQNRRAPAVATLVETYGDFRPVDGLVLPHFHQSELSNNGNSGMFKNTWGVKVQEYRLNQALQPGFFTFDPK